MNKRSERRCIHYCTDIAGSPFPSVSNITVTPGNRVMQLTWNAPNDSSKHWRYSIYYGDSISSLLEGKRIYAFAT